MLPALLIGCNAPSTTQHSARVEHTGNECGTELTVGGTVHDAGRSPSSTYYYPGDPVDYCDSDLAPDMTAACGLAFGSETCPTFLEMVESKDWFDLRVAGRLTFCDLPRSYPVDLDVATWVESIPGAGPSQTWFWRALFDHATGELLDLEVEVPEDNRPRWWLCCGGEEVAFASFRVSGQHVSGGDCRFECEYGPEDFVAGATRDSPCGDTTPP
jgi:hypothetical protein